MQPEHKGKAGGRVLVTGATGFLGRATADALERAGHEVVRGARAAPVASNPAQTWSSYGEIGPHTHWDEVLDGIGTVIHFAGLAHVNDASADPVAEAFHRVNAEGTARLATAAGRHGVRRFILVSSILVHGPGRAHAPFTETDTPRPANPYARSKLEAELKLKATARVTGMEWVILRPPMIYGPGVRGNFSRLVKLVRSGLPLPLGSATAPKSFLGIDNFVSAALRGVEHPGAANRLFLASDNEVTSSIDLIRCIGTAMGRRVLTPSVPAGAVRTAFRLIGRERDFRRLYEPQVIDSRLIRERLDWSPPVTMAEGVRRAVAGMSS